jgi:hypothetical protein
MRGKASMVVAQAAASASTVYGTDITRIGSSARRYYYD